MSEQPLFILYVDDEPLLLEVTREHLTRLGCNVDVAESGILALQKITDTTYDAIVSDYQMPKMDGITLLKEIRSRISDIPFILFTGRGREEVVIEAIESGADFYVQKGGKPTPQFTELFHKIQTAVMRRRDARALKESELRFRSLIQNSSDIIRILNKDGIILFESPSSSNILGYPEGSLIGQTAFDYIHPDDVIRVKNDFLDVYHRCNNHLPTEYRILKADGDFLYVQSIGLNLIGVPGIDGIVTTTHPVHHLKMAQIELLKLTDTLSAANEELISSEEELRENYLKLASHEQSLAESEERFRGMAERSSDLIIILNSFMSPTYVSPSVQAILGYSPDELVGKPCEFATATIFAHSGDDFLTSVHKTMKGEVVPNAQFQLTKKDGTPVYVNLNAVPIIQDGALCGAQVSMRDITALRKTEDALRETEDKFRRFAANAQDILYRMSLPGGRIEYISPAVFAQTGYTPEEFYADDDLFKRLIHPDWLEYIREQWTQILKKNVQPTYEYQIIDRFKKTHWYNQRNALVLDEHENPVALEGIVTDVTHQKTIEHELRKSEQRLLSVTLNAGSWIWEVDLRGVYTYSSQAVETILGYHPGELVGKVHFYDLFDISVRDAMKREVMEKFCTHKPISGFININCHKNGSLVILKTSGMPVFDENNIFCGYYGIDEDITKEKESQARLVESEAKYRLLADNVHDVIWTVDAMMNLTYISPSVQSLLGFTQEEAISRSFRDSLTIESYQKLMQAHDEWLDTLKNGGQIPEKTSLELGFKCRDGSSVWTEMIIKPVFDENNQFISLVGVTRDISVRKNAEDALRRANLQLSLLSGITRHEILNKISVIYVYLEQIQSQLSDPALLEYLKIMINITEEIHSQIEFTRIYELLGSHEPQWVHLETVMPYSSLPDSVTLTANISDVYLFADPMLEKIFFSLLDNSIRHGQRVTEIRVTADEYEAGLAVIWEDNGIGVANEEKELIFEHGFGNNTGFGLFLLREILSLTDITIIETGRSGKGVRFEMMVPKGAYRIKS